MERTIHTFDNGVKVYDDHLLPIQKARYKKNNVHEAEEEELFLQILETFPSNGLYVNIGSAIGYYPILAKKAKPSLTVHAVEPYERHRKFLVENLELNGFLKDSLVVHEEGIAESSGEASFLAKGYASAIKENDGKKSIQISKLKFMVRKILSKIGLRNSNILEMPKLIVIKTKTLDSLFQEIGKSIDLCQMDVQGLEVNVLKGAKAVMEEGQVKTFLIGTHSRKLHDDCIAMMAENGYSIEYEEYNTIEQPDGIVVASKGCQRL